MSMIEFQNVTFSYEAGKPVLKDLTFAVEKGESVGLIGANGAGKSTIMKLIPGLLDSMGRVRVDGISVGKDTAAEVRKKVGFVLQDPDSQMFMPTVLEDMIFGPMNYGLTKDEAVAKADRILAEMGLSDLRNRHNHRISGGEKKMAAIATILAMEPQAVIMDEPTASLDPYNRRTVINMIRSRSETKLIASHDLDTILDTCSRVILISGGVLAADGPAERILRDRALLEANRMELPLSYAGRASGPDR